MDRFLKYTKGREPVLSINVVAAVLLGAVVTLTTDRLGWQWDEYTLSLAGVVTLAAATWLARRGVWSPASHEQEVEAAYVEGSARAFDGKVRKQKDDAAA